MRFRAHSYMAFVFTPEPPIYDWLNELDAWLARSPDFFVDRPVVLNLTAASLSGSAIAHLIASLEERKIRVLGVEGVDRCALGPELPPLMRGGRPVNSAALLEAPPRDKAPVAPAKQPSSSLVIEVPIRSGQSVVFSDGERHEPVSALAQEQLRAGRARAAADSPRPRTQRAQRARIARHLARRNPGRDRQARRARPGQGPDQDGPRQDRLDARSRHRDSEPAGGRGGGGLGRLCRLG